VECPRKAGLIEMSCPESMKHPMDLDWPREVPQLGGGGGWDLGMRGEQKAQAG